jgi:SGNH hydrolase-like domain, acetyltransferase AlgX
VRTTWIKNVGLTTASLAMGLLLLETWARWELGRPALQYKQSERAAYTQFDPLLGWSKRPGARVVYRRPEYTTEVAINSHGLRDPERGYDAHGAWRILALGDSFVEGYSVPLADTVSQTLERGLGANGCRAEVINAGTGGYSTDQEFLFYRTEGLKYEPRIVLLFFFHNDVPFNAMGNYFGSPKPELVRLPRGLVPRSTMLTPRSPRAPEPDEAPPIVNGSAFWAWGRERLARGAPATYNRLARWGLWPQLRGEPSEALTVYRPDVSEPLAQGWHVTRDVLVEMQADALRGDTRFAVLYIPSLFELDDHVWDITRERYGLQGESWDRAWPQEHLKRLAQRAGADYLDLTPALRRANQGLFNSPYFGIDGHWNARGHHAAAQEIARFLREKGWLDGCPAAQAP